MMAKEPEGLRQEMLAALPAIRRFAYALTSARADADDLAQATVVRILERGAPEDADLRKWAFRVCRNMWIDELRARKVRRDAHAGADLAPSSDLDGERAAIGALSLAETERAIARLPEDQRAALALVAIEGLSYAEAAETLGAPIGTIMSRISRARAALANALPSALNAGAAG
jgi:RNA polymerase sigma-70 factor (ECF subfamily)